jgi:pimeloyl-ACP methyl ester carboxylesterase
MAVADYEREQIDRANESGRPPVAFVHGLWLLPSSWDRWRTVFEDAGYTTIAPGWPADPETVEDARQHPEVVADQSIEDVADHCQDVMRWLDDRPAIVGHSFGGLMAQILAGRGLSTATVALDPAPYRGVLPLPISALRSASAALRNPANYHRAVPLTFDQFRFAFANAVDEEEAKDLYETYAVPAPGKPLFQAAASNFNPWTEAQVNHENPARGPMLIIDGEKDHAVPWAIAHAEYKRQQHNEGVTEIAKIPNRGHSLTIDSGWREVCDTTLQFVQRFVAR